VSRPAVSSAARRKSRRPRKRRSTAAGVAYDECYRKACDDISNLIKTSLDQLADGAAHATLAFAQTTSALNGTD